MGQRGENQPKSWYLWRDNPSRTKKKKIGLDLASPKINRQPETW